MPLSFTYGNYPHIFDAFVADTSFEAQLALRLSCKSFQQAVDRLHVHHLVLTPHGSNSIDIKGAYRRIAALRRIKPAAWRKNPRLELTSHTRIVDIRGFFPATCNLTLLKDAFPNLDMLRMCTSVSEPKSYTPYIPFAAKTLVLWTTPEGGSPNPAAYDDWDEEMEDEPALFPKGASSKLDEKYTKIVVNMNGMDVPIADMFHCALDTPKHVTEVDIIFPEYVAATSRGRIHSMLEPIISMDTAELIGSPGVTYTLIGLDVINPNYDKHFKNVLRSHVSQWRFKDVDYGQSKSAGRGAVPPFLLGGGEGGGVQLPGLEGVGGPAGCAEQKEEDKSQNEGKGVDGGEEPKKESPKPTNKKKVTHKEKVDSILSAVETLTMKEYRDRLGSEQAALQSVEYLRPLATRSTGGGAGAASLMEQLGMSPDEMGEALDDFMEELFNPSEEAEAAMAEFMHEALNPSPEMEAAMAQFMYEALHPSPEMIQAMAECMAGMHGPLGAGAFPGAAIGAGLESETDEDEEDEDDEDEEDDGNEGEVDSDEGDGVVDEAEAEDDSNDEEDDAKDEGDEGSLSSESTTCGHVEEGKTIAVFKPDGSSDSKMESGQEPKKLKAA